MLINFEKGKVSSRGEVSCKGKVSSWIIPTCTVDYGSQTTIEFSSKPIDIFRILVDTWKNTTSWQIEIGQKYQNYDEYIMSSSSQVC